MIIKTKDGRRLMIALGYLQAIYPDRNEYCIQVAGQRFDVDGETGERILDECEKREREEQEELRMDMEKKSMVLAVIKKSAQEHTHDDQVNCIPLPPKADPGAWLNDFNEEIKE